MKKTIFAVLMVLAGMAVFAEGVSEQDVRDEYAKKGGFANRDAWLYEFNSVAADVIKSSGEVRDPNGYSWAADSDKRKFDNNCVKYKVLLDIGVELKYITDAVRKQQMVKVEDERKKVAKYLASKSGGLGLE